MTFRFEKFLSSLALEGLFGIARIIFRSSKKWKEKSSANFFLKEKKSFDANKKKKVLYRGASSSDFFYLKAVDKISKKLNKKQLVFGHHL
jgi:hypothetical protein